MPTSGCPANGSSVPGVKMRSAPRIRILDKDRLGETEIGRDRLPIRLRHVPAFEKNAERITPGASLADKDLQHMEPSQTDPFTSEPVAAAGPRPETSKPKASMPRA